VTCRLAHHKPSLKNEDDESRPEIPESPYLGCPLNPTPAEVVEVVDPEPEEVFESGHLREFLIPRPKRRRKMEPMLSEAFEGETSALRPHTGVYVYVVLYDGDSTGAGGKFLCQELPYEAVRVDRPSAIPLQQHEPDENTQSTLSCYTNFATHFSFYR
jgi:hypothetical protein